MPPIACSLNASDLAARQAEMRAVPLLGARVQLRFPPAARPDLERIVEAEARCCAFLTMDLQNEDEQLVLTVDAPQGGEAVLAALLQAFAG